jgi:hypothetical protein
VARESERPKLFVKGEPGVIVPGGPPVELGDRGISRRTSADEIGIAIADRLAGIG